MRLTILELLVALLGGCLVGLCLDASEVASRQEPEELQPVDRPTPLFDGGDLNDWLFFSNDAVQKDEVCSVSDGILELTGRPSGYLQSKRWYRDYVLDVEWRWPEKGGNSGVLVHTTTPLLFYGWPRSLEVQLMHGRAGDFWVIGKGVDLRVTDEEARRAKPRGGDQHSHRRIARLGESVEMPIGEWNRMTVTCRGDEITVEVNGHRVNHGTGCSIDRGAIALQSEGARIQFRRVTIRPLPTPTKSRELRFEQADETFSIWEGEQLFATLREDDGRFPYVWPLLGPNQTPMTRGYPMHQGEHETPDHPHHRSFWLAHGDVNGHDFWSGKDTRIEPLRATKGERVADSIRLESHYRWHTAGVDVIHEQRTLRFFSGDDERGIDVESRLRAVNGSVRFGDTKEGTFAVRVHPRLRVDGPVARGSVETQNGHRDAAAWGKRAGWVEYNAEVDGSRIGLAIFDHPRNPRYPTYWHARGYGLAAANPFGVHDFTGKPKGTGDLLLPEGETLVLRYRVLLSRRGIETTEERRARRQRDWRQWARPGVSIDLTGRDARGQFHCTPDPAWRVATVTENDAERSTLELVDQGEYQPPFRSPGRIALIADSTFEDFRLEVDVMQTGKEYGHRDLCFFFGFRDQAHYYYAHLATTPDENAGNIFIVDGAPRRRLAAIPATGVDWGENEWHRVRIDRDASGWVRVYFDDLDDPIFEARDATHGAGWLGVGSFDDTGRFANLRVWGRPSAPPRRDPFTPR